MVKPFIRRPVIWMLLVTLLISALALSACGGGGPSQTVNIKETKGASGDVYFCDPASITVNKGETVNFTNQSDENQDFDAGDAKKAGVDFKIGLNQTVQVTFNNTGTFKIQSEKSDGTILATITVTVK
jgi:plastocyanin